MEQWPCPSLNLFLNQPLKLRRRWQHFRCDIGVYISMGVVLVKTWTLEKSLDLEKWLLVCKIHSSFHTSPFHIIRKTKHITYEDFFIYMELYKLEWKFCLYIHHLMFIKRCWVDRQVEVFLSPAFDKEIGSPRWHSTQEFYCRTFSWPRSCFNPWQLDVSGFFCLILPLLFSPMIFRESIFFLFF